MASHPAHLPTADQDLDIRQLICYFGDMNRNIKDYLFHLIVVIAFIFFWTSTDISRGILLVCLGVIMLIVRPLLGFDLLVTHPWLRLVMGSIFFVLALVLALQQGG